MESLRDRKDSVVSDDPSEPVCELTEAHETMSAMPVHLPTSDTWSYRFSNMSSFLHFKDKEERVALLRFHENLQQARGLMKNSNFRSWVLLASYIFLWLGNNAPYLVGLLGAESIRIQYRDSECYEFRIGASLHE